MDAHGLSPEADVGCSPAARLARRAMVMVVGVLAVGAVVPALASARTEWKLNSIPVSSSLATEWSGKLKVVDTNVPVVEKESVECSDKAEGTVGIGGAGEITKVSMSSCKGVQICGPNETYNNITAINLPWVTEMAVVEGKLHEAIVSSGEGTPGFKVACYQFNSYRVTDECTGKLGLSTTNTESGVTAAFLAGEKLNCTLSGANDGYTEGSQSIVASKGGTLSAVNEEPPTWLKGGVPIEGDGKAVEWKGSLTLVARGSIGPLGVSCEDSGQGVAGLGGIGSITKLTMSNCGASRESECKGEYAIAATHLPWSTELYSGAKSAVGDLIASGGTGIPGFTLTCFEHGLKGGQAECKGIPTTGMADNSERGVTATFADERIACNLGSEGGELTGTQTINLTSGETLHVS